MDIPAFNLPPVLNTSENAVFFRPREEGVIIDEDDTAVPPPCTSIDSMIASLKKYGPLIAEARTGPSAYAKPAALKQSKACGQEVYGWHSKDRPAPGARSVTVMIVGAQKTDKVAYIYFRLTTDVTANKDADAAFSSAARAATGSFLHFRIGFGPGERSADSESSLIRKYVASEVDPRLFAVPAKVFIEESMRNLHPVCPLAEWLFTTVPTRAILIDPETKAACKTVGQRIFDHYKEAFRGDERRKSEVGHEAVVRICDAAKYLGNDRDKKGNIERAWDGIGDKNWTWRA